MLSRLHRKAEALDHACLRAHGHPHDYAVRQELLSALEWDASLHPEHASPVIRTVFKEVHDHANDLLIRIQAAQEIPGVVIPVSDLPTLRQKLATLIEILTARHREAPVR